MGGGNAQKSAMARLRNADKAKKAAGGMSQQASNTAALTIICNICRQSFMCNMTQVKLQEHVDSKHAKKNTFVECFPNFGK